MSKRNSKNSLNKRLNNLQELIANLNEEESIAELQAMLAEGVDAKILLACCMDGMYRVGVLFETGKYFIAGLIMAGEIMRSATELLTPFLSSGPTTESSGSIMLGTIQGDIHDLGKNLFALLLKCNGFEVIDIGVDIPPSEFLTKALAIQPDIIGISCVLTNSVDNLKTAVDLLYEQLPAPGRPIVIGGACLDEQLAGYIGAQYWAQDAADGLKLCQNILAGTGQAHQK